MYENRLQSPTEVLLAQELSPQKKMFEWQRYKRKGIGDITSYVEFDLQSEPKQYFVKKIICLKRVYIFFFFNLVNNPRKSWFWKTNFFLLRFHIVPGIALGFPIIPASQLSKLFYAIAEKLYD